VRDAGFGARFERLWSTKRVVTAAEHVGLPVAALESQRRQLWTAVARKPAAGVRAPAAGASRARIEWPPKRSAKGGRTS
jgi:hypothetical protein